MKSGAAALICRNMGNLKLAASSKCLLNHFCWVSLSQNSNLGRQTTVKIWQMESAMPCVQTQDCGCCRLQSLFNSCVLSQHAACVIGAWCSMPAQIHIGLPHSKSVLAIFFVPHVSSTPLSSAPPSTSRKQQDTHLCIPWAYL